MNRKDSKEIGNICLHYDKKISVTQQRTCYKEVSSPILCNYLRDRYHFYLRDNIFDQSELNEGFVFDNNSICFIAFSTINNHDMHIEQNRYEGCKAIVLETHDHNNTIYDIFRSYFLMFQPLILYVFELYNILLTLRLYMAKFSMPIR